MTEINNKYEAVIGLEVHCQLSTKTKAFSSDPYTYGSPPNTQVSPISLGHPGTLPRPNLEALQYALKMGIACQCEIHERTHYSRKNYFYADLPKGYQITQYVTPICTGGYITINTEDGKTKNIRLNKIILEEDSGKSIHDIDPFASLIDLNRAGVPLIEVVSEADMHLPEEAYQYLTEIRKLVRYLGICDGNMEEGSLRCDANISVMPIGQKEFNTKVEIKNLNSIRNVQRAITYEIQRQSELYDNGGEVLPETRGFDAAKGETFAMRSKEMLNDYRYFPEPDIPPCVVNEKDINGVKEKMPVLPRELHRKLIADFGLSEYDAAVITAEKELADYYQETITYTGNYKGVSNLLNGPLRSIMNERAIDINKLNDVFPPENAAKFVDAITKGVISGATGSTVNLISQIIDNGGAKDEELERLIHTNMQIGNKDFITHYIIEVLEAFPDKVAEYKGGKKGILGMLIGEVRKKSERSLDAKIISKLIEEELNK